MSNNSVDYNNIPSYVINKISNYLKKETDDCINYDVTINKDGYGYIRSKILGKRVCYLVHRVAYCIANKQVINKDNVIMHICDNPRCINPKHLRLGTHIDNVVDKVNKGRQAKGINNHNYKYGHYSKYVPFVKYKTSWDKLNNRNKTYDEVKYIKDQINNRGNMSLTELAQKINFSIDVVKSISSGRTYKDVI